LFLVAGPSSSATPEVKAALRKLVRALPEPFRDAAEAASTAVVVDPAGWDQPARQRPPPPHLDAVQQAVVDGVQVALGYVARDRTASSRVVHPLGLASKGSSWYLVAATEGGLRTFRVDRITAVDPTGEPVVRPEGFDLADAWRLIADEVDQRRAPITARATVAMTSLAVVRLTFGTRLRIGPPVGGDRVEVELRGHNVASLAGEIAGFGAAVEVLEPPAVRQRLALLAAELGSLYA
jgi:predicted DNA-binding transcriptional regulator YafY